MTRVRDVQGEILRRLETLICQGRYTPGQVLPIGALAARFRASATPVREALAKLEGAGLVIDTRGRGYACLAADARSVRQLYRLHEAQLLWATQLSPLAPSGRPKLAALLKARAACGLDYPETALAELVFKALATASGNDALADEQRVTFAKLGRARRGEARLALETISNLEALASASDDGDAANVERQLRLYHQTRSDRVDEIVNVTITDIGHDNILDAIS